MQTSGRGDLLAAEPEYATRYGRPIGQQTSNRGELLAMDAEPTRSQNMLLGLDPEYVAMLNGVARSQGGWVGNPQSTKTVTAADALARSAAIRRAREMQRPNLAAQAGSGVRGRAPVAPSSGSGVLDRLALLQNNNAANRFINSAAGQGENTVQARARRRDSLLGMLDAEALGNRQDMAGAAERLNQLNIARTDAVGGALRSVLPRVASAAGNVLNRFTTPFFGGSGSGAGAGEVDTNGDGVISDDERLKAGEKALKIEQSLMNPDGTMREPTEIQKAVLGMLRQRMNPSQIKVTTGQDMQEGDGFVDTSIIPNVDTAAPRGQQLPSTPTLNAQGQPLAAPKGPNARQLEMLRQGMNDPRMIQMFEQKFGPGSAAAYLRG